MQLFDVVKLELLQETLDCLPALRVIAAPPSLPPVTMSISLMCIQIINPY